MNGPWWFLIVAALLVLAGLIESLRSDELLEQGDVRGAWTAWLRSRAFGLLGVLAGAGGVAWELAR